MAEQKLLKSLADVRRRLLRVSLACGVAWGVTALLLVLIACAWVDLVLDLPAGLRLACTLTAVGAGVLLVGWAAVKAARESTQAALARRLDGVANTRGEILSGVDLSHQYAGVAHRGSPAAAAQPAGLSAALARMAIERAATLAGAVGARSAVPTRPVATPLLSLGGIVLVLGLVGLVAPRLFATEWSRFTDPFGDHPPYSSITFDVQPGHTRVLYGSALDVRATADGGVVEQLDLVLVPEATGDKRPAEEVLPMFPEPGGAWRATVADVTAAGRYFVRTRGARSRQFGYGLITVPEIRDVKFRVTPPAYTRRPAYEGPLPQNGLAGLAGTKVEVWAKSNRPLSAGTLTFTPAAGEDAANTSVEKVAPAGPVAMTPIGAGASEVSGSFVITRPGKIDVTVSDVAGQTSKDTFSASVAVLNDDRPFVRLMEPKPNSFATPDVTLPVVILAEDDYGVTRVQLFRSLNDSRPLGTDASVPQPPATKVPVTVNLPLAQYGLVPGDVIKLFARVEDNDPAGAKGSESPIVTVQIISKEDLNRMILAREGMEVLQSKYEEARRRMEAVDEEIRKLQEEMKGADPKGEVSKEMQKKLDALADRIAKEADEIEKNAAEDLPFDLDANLRAELKELADGVRDAGEEFKKETDPKNGGVPSISVAGEKLNKLREQLGTKREEFKQEVSEPLEHLAKIFPLKEDEARFADLYLRQRDLAERMAALKPSAGDDPGSKARMRDLENEQRQMREELRDLLDDIESHARALPEGQEERIDALREMATQFAEAVRTSPAADEMQSSEVALSEFTGPPAAQWSKQAADTLEKFLGQCEGGMGEQASTCLGFQPKLAGGLGNTVDQLLNAQGLGMKPGMGMGGGGGYSARRSTLANVGLYGNLPRMSRAASARNGEGRADRGGATRSEGDSADLEDPNGYLSSGRLKAAGESGAHVPAQYRTKVGQYFQRVADELGE